MYIVHTTTELS